MKAKILSAVAVATFFAMAGPLAGVCFAAEAEKDKLAKCEKDICSIIVGKEKTGADLSCDLAKTWSKDDIEKGAKEKSLSLGLGQTRCSGAVAMKRADILNALTLPEYTMKADKQAVACEVDRNGEKYTVNLTLAPELKFKGGKTTSASLHVANIEGAALIKGVVWMAATLEQNVGLFETDIVREVNRFIEKQCPKRMAAETK